jgi:hypothetical protein
MPSAASASGAGGNRIRSSNLMTGKDACPTSVAHALLRAAPTFVSAFAAYGARVDASLDPAR